MPAALPEQGKISQSSNAGVDYKVVEVKFGDGYSQRALDGLNYKRRSWSIEWSNVNSTEYTTIMTALDTAAGVDYFTWTPPGQSAGRWIASSVSVNVASGDIYSISATLREVFDL